MIGSALSACGSALPDASHGPNEGPPGVAADASVGDAAIATVTDAGAPDAKITGPLLGANVGDGEVVFRVWAPNATAAWVTGNFPEAKVAMTATAGSVFEAHVKGAHAGSTYDYVFDSPAGSITRLDPYCRELLADACLVVDPNAYAWKSPTFTRPTKNAAVVYELHLGSFAVDAPATQGTLASARTRLAGLADLGVNVVELLPIHDFGGSNGWGYNPQLWLAPKPTYGTTAELRAFVDEAHRLGIAVWIDMVVNHSDGWSKAPLTCFDGLCPGGSAGVYFFPNGPYARTPWGPRPDYTQPEVASMLIASVEEWLVEYRGDGFRWDSTSNIRALDGQGTTPGGRELLVRANDRTRALGGTSVAEDLKGWDGITRAASTGGFGFDAQWDGFGYGITSLLSDPNDDARDLGAVASALSGTYAGDPFARLLFTEDHDTVGNGGARLPAHIDAANPTSWAARKRSMLGAVLLLTAPGVPMLFMGQESLNVDPFLSPPLPLATATAGGQKIAAFYKDMIHLRRGLGSGAGGLLDKEVEVFHRNDTAKVIAYRRHGTSNEDVIVVVNLKNKAYAQYDIGVPDAGPWRVRLNTDHLAYGDDFVEGQSGSIIATATAKDGKPFSLPLQLGAYGAMVLTR